MVQFESFLKACPVSFRIRARVDLSTPYKYYLCGKRCVLGVLFEDSIHLYFEWITENDTPVPYPPEIRYKYWPKDEVVRLIQAGVWDVETECPRFNRPRPLEPATSSAA